MVDDFLDAEDVTEPAATEIPGGSHLPSLVAQKPAVNRRHAFQTPCKKMYIMFACDEQPAAPGTWIGHEQVLCCIKSYEDGRVIVAVRF